MVKLVFMICAFLLLSVVQHGQGGVINSTENKIMLIIDAAFEKVQNVVEQFEVLVNIALDKIRDAGKALQEKLKDKIDESLDLLNEQINIATEQVNPDCQVLVNNFRSNVLELYHNTSECVNNHIQSGLQHIEKINDISYEVLAKLDMLREEAHDCTKNVNSPLDYATAGLCLTKVLVKANVAVAVQVPAVSLQALKLTVNVNLLPVNVVYCAGTETFHTLTEQFTTTMEEVQYCIQASADGVQETLGNGNDDDDDDDDYDNNSDNNNNGNNNNVSNSIAEAKDKL